MIGEANATLREKMARGERILALRTGFNIEKDRLKAALALNDYDLIYVDGQHSPFTDPQLLAFCTMAGELGYPVEMRLPHTRLAYLAGRYCDFGLIGVLVPEVMYEAEAREAIDATFYQPEGRRSFGGGTRHGMSVERADAVDYARWWNRNGTLGIQLESVEAIVNARQLAMPGVSYVSFGPTDLRFSLEAHPEFPFRTVEDCIAHVARQLAGSRIPLGIAVTLDPEERERYAALGLTVFMEAPLV